MQNSDIFIEIGPEAIYLVPLVIAVALFLALFPWLIIGAIAKRRAEKIYNHNVGTVVAEYKPPRDLSPAEIGLLYDMGTGKKEIISTLFDLEQRGIVHLDASMRAKLANSSQHKVLLGHEKIAIDISNESNELTSSTALVIGNKASENIKLFDKSIQNTLAKKGMKMKSYKKMFIIRTIELTLLVTLWPMMYVLFTIVRAAIVYNYWIFQDLSAFSQTIMIGVMTSVVLAMFLLPVYVLVSLLAVWLWTKITGRYWLNSRKVRAIWPELEGFKMYIELADLARIQFESTDSEKPVTDTFPYAIAFGLETKWRERLKER